MALATFYVWVDLLTDRAATLLAAGLVRRGFAVEAASANNNLTVVGTTSALCAMRLNADHMPDTMPTDVTPHSWCLGHVTGVLGDVNEPYYSIVVNHIDGTFTWRGSNISEATPQPVKPPPEPVKTDTTSALDRVDKAIG